MKVQNMKKALYILMLIVAVVLFVLTINEMDYSDLSWSANRLNYGRIVVSVWIFYQYFGKVFSKKETAKTE